MNPHAQLLNEAPDPERLVRNGLALLEADFRDLALLALADWERCDIVAPELFSAVASLQRPSWGMWNGLITALRSARRSALRTADEEARARVESAATLTRILNLFDMGIDGSRRSELKLLANLTGVTMGKRLRVGSVLTMAIALRNRVAHDSPTDRSWWNDAANALRPLLEIVAAHSYWQEALAESEATKPWFREEGGQRLAFNGVNAQFSVNYISRGGRGQRDDGASRMVLLAFQRLLGKTQEQAKDFRKLLSKLAPEEIRGVMLGDYLLGRPIGSGGFATVHVGRQLSTGRKVAIKVLHDGMPEDARQRFRKEAAFLSKFSHPNIVSVLGFGEETWSAPRQISLSDEDWFQELKRSAPVKTFIALEWVEGRTLDEIFHLPREKRPAIDAILSWFHQSAKALSVVHSAGLIHRDVKPGNMMVDDSGVLKLMDFGIARTQDENRTIVTETGAAIGTPAYMSPEQLRGAGELTPATDVYSVCATFYELITGARVFQHDTADGESVRTNKLRGLPIRPRKIVRSLPIDLETIIIGGLQPEAFDRYATAEALERDIAHYQNWEPVEIRRPSMVRRTALAYRRNRVFANLLIAAVAAVLSLLIGGVIQSTRHASALKGQTSFLRERQKHAEAKWNERRRGYERQIATLFIDAGMDRHQAGRLAVLHLSEAYTRLGDENVRMDGTLGFLLARSLEPYAGQTAIANVPGTTSTAWSRSERFVAVADGSRHVRFWNSRTRGQTGSLPEPHEVVRVGISASDQLLSASPTGVVRVVSLIPGDTTAVVHEVGAPVSAMSVSDNNERLAVATDKSVQIRRLSTGDLEHTIRASDVIGVTLDPTGALVAFVTNSGEARVVESATGRTRRVVRLDARGESAAVSPDGGRIIVAMPDGTARLLHAGSGRTLHTLRIDGERFVRASFSPLGQVITVSDAGTIRRWNLREIETPRSYTARGIHEAQFEGNSMVQIRLTDGSVRRWGFTGLLSNARKRKSPFLPGFATVAENTITVQPDDDDPALTSTIPAEKLTPLRELQYMPLPLEKKRRRWRVAAVSALGQLHVWDESGNRIDLERHGNEEYRNVRFTTEAMVIAIDSSNRVRRWDTRPGRDQGTDEPIDNIEGAQRLEVSHAGNLVAIATATRIHIVGKTRNVLHSFPAHAGNVHTLAFSDDNTWLLAASSGRVDVHNVAPETRSAKEIANYLKCTLPWRLGGGTVEPAVPKPEECAP